MSGDAQAVEFRRVGGVCGEAERASLVEADRIERHGTLEGQVLEIQHRILGVRYRAFDMKLLFLAACHEQCREKDAEACL